LQNKFDSYYLAGDCHGGLDPPSPDNYQEIAGLRFATPAMTLKAVSFIITFYK